MGHTDVSKTFVGIPKVTGGIWRYPMTVTMPTTAYDARPGGGVFLGGVSEDGYTYTSERQTEKKKDWNGDKVRSIQQNKDDKFETTFIEFLNPNVMALVHGNDNVTVSPATNEHGTHIVTKSVADVLEHYAYIVDTFDGKVKRRRVVYDAQVESHDPIVEKPGDWSVYKLLFDMFPNAQGSTNNTYTELDDKIVPAVWEADIAGSAGTVVYTVDGQSTTALPYNATTSALDTALELLSTVGADGATVTGTAGDYTITLVNGGTLSAVGSGGATATVEPGA